MFLPSFDAGIVTLELQNTSAAGSVPDALDTDSLKRIGKQEAPISSLQSRELELQNKTEQFKIQYRLVSDLVSEKKIAANIKNPSTFHSKMYFFFVTHWQVRSTHDKLSESKAKQVALNMASEVLRSLESVYLKSAMSVEREWICWSKNYTSDRTTEFKFQAIESYDVSDELLDTAKLVLEKIESKTNSFLPNNAPAS